MKLRALLLILILFLGACKSKTQKSPPPPATVTDFVVASKDIPAVFDFIGFAESIHPVEIRARVEGYLDKIAYQEGALVHEGDLLFQLDPKPFEAKVAQAKAEVARQEAILQNAVLTVNRLKPLYEKNAASKKDLDNAIAGQLSSEASVLAAKANLLSNEIDLGYTTITSPITGLANRSNFREGALINPGANTLMTTVSVMDPIWVYFPVSDNDILRVQKGETEKKVILPKEDSFEVEAIMSDGSVYSHKGKVDFKAPTYDQSTGTLLARAVFPNPETRLLPGQFVRIKVYGAVQPNALFVPRSALIQKSNGMFVYLIDEHNKAIPQDVSTGQWYGEYQVITNGLKVGDRIIVDGINKVVSGSEVKVVGTWKPLSEKSAEATKE